MLLGIFIVVRSMENLLSLVVNATDNCIYAKDRDLRFLFVNSAVSRLYEADAESMIGKRPIAKLKEACLTTARPCSCWD